MDANKYHGLVADIAGGVGRCDLRRDDERRTLERDIEITDISCVVIEGDFLWNRIVVETDPNMYGVRESFTGSTKEHVGFPWPGLIGQNSFDVDRLVDRIIQLLSEFCRTTGYAQASISGIETALFNAVDKLLKLAIYQLLGSKYRDEVRTYADCHADEPLSEANTA